MIDLDEWEVDKGWSSIPGAKWVKVLVEIRHNATGRINVDHTTLLVTPEEIADLDEPSTSTWEEGNYSCDCNRRIFYYRAGGTAIEIGGAHDACGDGAYSVRLRNAKTGKVFYDEFDQFRGAS
jgi:hypothetical protein